MSQEPGFPGADPPTEGSEVPPPPAGPPALPDQAGPPGQWPYPPAPFPQAAPSGQWSYPPVPSMPPGMSLGMGSAPPGMYFDPATGLTLPVGTALAPVGRRVGAYFLSIVLAIVTLVIGYIVWGAILWGRGTSPALNVLGMRAWNPESSRPAGWWRMALRDVVGGIVQGLLGAITGIVSFILFLATKEHRTLCDLVGGTVIIYDPNKILPQR